MTQVVIPLRARMRGLFKMEAVKPDGSRRLLADWQDNLITDYGLNALGTQTDMAIICHVGTGSTPPTYSDTALVGWVARNSSKVGDGFYTGSPYGARPTPPYYGWKRGTFRFAAGTATGNLSEVGLSRQSTNGNLFTRALIKDTDGNPTTITILADEMLDVTYEIRMYPPLEDVETDLVISGVLYHFSSRAANVTSSYWGYFVDHVGGSEGNGKYAPGTDADLKYGCTTLGPITASVDGTKGGGVGATIGGMTNLAYSDGSLFRDVVLTFATDNFNNPAGASGVHLVTTKGVYQVLISPAIPKTSVNNLQLIFRVSWGRYTP